ncbi:MAG: carboxylesterase/lipase family protein [Acidimicrobiales bacterium]
MATEVMTTAGRVGGRELGLLTVFRGIPYAEPPIGSLRWRPPLPAAPWSGTLGAVAFGAAAPQTAGPPSALPRLDAGPMDEDCLTLNVWAPSDAHDRPVLVWIHGGGFTTGGTAIPSYDCARLAAEHDIVVVSANYRLGALGFAPIAGTSNLGLLDQLLALEWVRDNIDGFGGAPDAVTVFGESAGAGAILHLLAAPAASGLFHRAIVQSGATTLTLGLDQTLEVADRVRFALGVDPMTAPVGAILEAQDRVAGDLVATLGAMPFHPSVDGEVVPCRPVEAVSDSRVDLLIGTTRDELNTYLDPAAPTLEAERLRKRATRYLAGYGIDGPEPVLAAYADLPSPAHVWAAMRTDAEMWLPALAIADAHGGRTFMYRFDWPAAPPNDHLGACHAIDIPFTFGTFETAGWDDFVGYDADAARLGDAIREAWSTFAATGDPSTKRLDRWSPYSTPTRATMLLGREQRMTTNVRGDVRDAWAAAREKREASAS